MEHKEGSDVCFIQTRQLKINVCGATFKGKRDVIGCLV